MLQPGRNIPMSKHTILLTYIAVAACVLPMAAKAENSAFATLETLTVQLLDLDPSDGVTPSITFLQDSHIISGAYTYLPRGSEVKPEFGVHPWTPISSTSSTQWATSTASITGPATAQDSTFSASGRSNLPISGNLNINQAGYYARATSRPIDSTVNFSLSANTKIVVAATATIAGSASTSGITSYYNRDYASSVASLAVSSGEYASYDYIAHQLDTSVYGNPESYVDSRTVTVSFSNATDYDVYGSLDVIAKIDGGAYASASAVPEPTTTALMLAGLTAVGAIASSRRGQA